MNNTIAIIDYGIGNVQSIENALNKFGIKGVLTKDKDTILEASGIILPGVGAFKKAMDELIIRDLHNSINEFVKTDKPLLGLCLGMQLLFDNSQEFGLTQGLGLIQGEVSRLPVLTDLKLPHIEWGSITEGEVLWENTILDNLRNNERMYFIHSYVCNPRNKKVILATSKYGDMNFCAAVKSNNIYGCQFHPEKSSEFGLAIIKNFINLSLNKTQND